MIRFYTHAARCLRAACVFAVAASCDRPAGNDGPSVRTIVEFRSIEAADGSGFGDVDVHPLNRAVLSALAGSDPSLDQWQKILSVRVGSKEGADRAALPLLGTYTVTGDTLRFRPRFRPVEGVVYEARFDGSALYALVGRSAPRELARVSTAAFSYDVARSEPRTVVREVYPTSDVVPMNLLRMYVEFSAPMSSGRSYDFIKLYADGDSLVPEPFFTAAGAVELWDPEHTRLTILFDPGRIKRDLEPHEEMGLPLQTGKRYRLVIDRAWHDAQGRPLVRGYEKQFRVGPQDRTLVRTADWRMSPPNAGTRDSLVVTFPEPLDRALLLRLLTVRDSAGGVVPGTALVSDRETRWAFGPSDSWKSGAYALHVDTELEDLAGNNLRKLFDVAPGDAGAIGVTAAAVRLPFQPR